MNILIVEDEDVILEELKDSVSSYVKPFQITACNNPLLALELSETQNFDIALLDIEMPNMKGIELAERLYEKQPHIKVAFVTAYNNFATEAFELYTIDYVLKPVREERLHKCLSRLIEAMDPLAELSKPSVAIKAFGNLEVRINGVLVNWKRKKAYETFAYLLANHNKPIRKEKLIDELFPDYDLERGSVHLQTVISHIRKLGLEINYFDHAYMYSTAGVVYDVEDFLLRFNLIKKARQLLDIDSAIELVDLYNGAFLEEDGFMWGLSYTTQLEMLYLELLDILMARDEVVSDKALFKKIEQRKNALLEG